jgi:hypothetical protein
MALVDKMDTLKVTVELLGKVSAWFKPKNRGFVLKIPGILGVQVQKPTEKPLKTTVAFFKICVHSKITRIAS